MPVCNARADIEREQQRPQVYDERATKVNDREKKNRERGKKFSLNVSIRFLPSLGSSDQYRCSNWSKIIFPTHER